MCDGFYRDLGTHLHRIEMNDMIAVRNVDLNYPNKARFVLFLIQNDPESPLLEWTTNGNDWGISTNPWSYAMIVNENLKQIHGTNIFILTSGNLRFARLKDDQHVILNIPNKQFLELPTNIFLEDKLPQKHLDFLAYNRYISERYYLYKGFFI